MDASANYKELMEENKRLHEEWKKLPAGSEERLELEIEMADIGEWMPNGKHDYIDFKMIGY